MKQALDYYPYGAQRINTGTDASDRRFIGQFADDATSLDYLNARYYDPARGQFTSQDPCSGRLDRRRTERRSWPIRSFKAVTATPVGIRCSKKDPDGSLADAVSSYSGSLEGGSAVHTAAKVQRKPQSHRVVDPSTRQVWRCAVMSQPAIASGT